MNQEIMPQDSMEPFPMPPPQGGHASEGALQYQIDPDAILEDIEHALKCEIFRVNPQTGVGGWSVPDGVQPIVNQHGINSILAILKSRLTKIFILSDLEEDQIRNITVSIGRNVIDDMYFNWNRYGIKDSAAASTVLYLVTDTVYATLRKAYMGNYLKFLRTTQTIQEVAHHTGGQRQQQMSSAQQTDSILGRIFGKRR